VIPGGQKVSGAAVFNHSYGSSLSGLQIEEAVILHELWHIAGGTAYSTIDGYKAKRELLEKCVQ
jgi:hypothetical protein